jgi:hypothetical protein
VACWRLSTQTRRSNDTTGAPTKKALPIQTYDYKIQAGDAALFKRAMLLSDTVLEHVAENLRKPGLPE